MKYEILEEKLNPDSKYSKGFLPAYANKEDLSLLNRFIEMQSKADYTDEIDLLFSDKTALAKSSVLNIISQIKERIAIKENNLKNIEYGISNQRTRLFNIEDLFANSYSFDVTKAKNDIEKAIESSEKEKREQEVSCWRDLALLRKDLMFGMNEYKSNSRKKQLITGSSLEGVVQYE
ncbi:MAG: hypothetical protein ABII64_02370 [Elusimicrobiota bacterium]